MILHTLNALPDSGAWQDCLVVLAPGDALLLLGDGVYAALVGSNRLEELDVPVYVLAPDAIARGVAGRLAADVQQVDMAGFVELTERFARQMAWY